MWSMELSRRFAQGTLSEIYGFNYIYIDALIREFGPSEYAKEELAKLD